MILTHLVAFKFFPGAGSAASVSNVATGPLCFEAVQVVSPWIDEVHVTSPWVEQLQAVSPWIEEVQVKCN
jgi:hypothetical protein